MPCPALLLVRLESHPFLAQPFLRQPLNFADFGDAPLQSLVQTVIGFLRPLGRPDGVVEGRDLNLRIRDLLLKCLVLLLPLLPDPFLLHLRQRLPLNDCGKLFLAARAPSGRAR